MAAITFNFSVEAGAGYRATFVQATSDGTPIPFAEGTAAEFQARVTARAPSAVLTLTGTAGTPDLGTVTVDAPAGKVHLHMTDAGTRSFDMPSVDSVVYAVEIYEPGQDTKRFVEGKLSCSPEVVR
jgi:hypothetical protein